MSPDFGSSAVGLPIGRLWSVQELRDGPHDYEGRIAMNQPAMIGPSRERTAFMQRFKFIPPVWTARNNKAILALDPVHRCSIGVKISLKPLALDFQQFLFSGRLVGSEGHRRKRYCDQDRSSKLHCVVSPQI
jgi:hypothetical protein